MAINLDWSHMLNRNVHANRDTVIENPDIVAHLMLNMVLSEIDKFGASKQNPLIVCVDSKPYWREQYYNQNKGMFPEYQDKKYKGQRVKDTAFDWDAIRTVSSRCLYALDQWTDIKVARIPTAEADDIIAVSSEYYSSRGQRVVNVTSDKDLRQTQVYGKVDIYDPIKKLILPEFNIDRMKKLHIMQGDKGDNILAIKPRLGEKTAEKLYPELDMILATDPEMRSRYAFNEKLIDLQLIPEDLKATIIESLEKPHENFDGFKLMNAFTKLGLSQMMDKMSKFKLQAQSNTTVELSQKEPSAFNIDDIFN